MTSPNEHYLGNKNLKRVGIPVEFTSDQVKEYVKCSKDASYFIKTYMKIVHIDRGLVDFAPYAYQERIIDASVNNRFVICKLPRQAGKTTFIQLHLELDGQLSLKAAHSIAAETDLRIRAAFDDAEVIIHQDPV